MNADIEETSVTTEIMESIATMDLMVPAAWSTSFGFRPAFNIVSEAYSSGWRRVSEADVIELDSRLRGLGWGFSFVAGELKGISFGTSRPRMLKAAVRNLLAQVRSQDFNCAEFTKVTSSHFLGIPYISVRGHARHIQHGCELDTAEMRKKQQSEADWAFSRWSIGLPARG